MFCLPLHYDHLIFEQDFGECGNCEKRDDSALHGALRSLPRFGQVDKAVSDKLLRVATICNDYACSCRSVLTVSVSETGGAVKFLLEQPVFADFLPAHSSFGELLQLIAGFVAVPKGRLPHLFLR